MNKKLIAVAIAAAVAAPAAMANDTTLYGKAHVSIGNYDDGSADMWKVESHASRLGVKGSEDLGNGLKAIFKYEFGIQVDDSDGVNSGRNAYVGLSGDFGTVLAGRHDTPAKVAFYAAGNETIGDSIIDINSKTSTTSAGFSELRLDNAVAYISPNFSGFTAAAAVVPGETSGNNGLADAYSVGLMYSGNGIKASAGYEVADSNMVLGSSGTAAGGLTIGADDHEMFQVGASVTFGDFMVGANYEDTSNYAGTASDKEVWAITGKAGFGNNYVTARYMETEIGTWDADTFHIGAGHKMSKRTQVYVAYENEERGGTDTDQFALGMIHSF